MRSGGPITRAGNAAIGNVGPSAQGGLALGPDPGDVTWYRSATGVARLSGAAIIDSTASIGQAKLVGTALSLALQDSSGNGILKANFTAAFTDSTNIQQLEIGNQATNNDGVISGLTGVALRRLGVSAQGVVLANALSSALPIPTPNSLRIEYTGGRGTLNLTSTGVETGITIGGDVEIFRSAADTLKTPDTIDAGAFRQGGVSLASTNLSDTANIGLTNTAKTWSAIQTFSADVIHAGGDVRVRASGDTFDKVRLGWDGYVYFGSGTAVYDVTLRRPAVGQLRSSGTLDAIGSITANIGGANQVALGVSSAGIVLGLAGDANLYRAAAGTLKTDGVLQSGGIQTANVGTLGQVQVGAIGPASAPGVTFGTDVTVYRSAAGMVTIASDLTVRNLTVTGTQTSQATQTSVGSIVAASANSGQVRVGNPGGEGTIFFGTAEDTSLARNGANQLRTPNALEVNGLLTALLGVTVSGGPLRANRIAATNEAFSAQTAGVSRLRVLANGTLEWAATDGTADTSAQLVRSAAGVISASGAVNAVGYQVGGVALASTHLSDTAGVARLASPTFTGTVTAPILVGTTRHEAVGGTAAAPSYAFTGNTTTGLYSPGADQVAVATAGVSRLTIGSTGIVNIPGSLTIAGTGVVLTTDSRLTDARNPSGSAGGELSGNYPSPTVAPGVITNAHVSATAAIADSKLATIATVGKVADTAIPATVARVASPSLTGNPTAPTATIDTNTTQLATTAFVLGQAGSVIPAPNGVGAAGTSLRYARQDHIHTGDTNRAPLDSPTFTGIPSAPTATAGNSTTQLATTAFVTAALGGSGGASFSALTLTASGLTTLNLTNNGGGITIGDTNWYRSIANTMKTDSSLHVAGDFRHLGNNVGFYNVAAVARQVRPTTIAEIITVLVNLGLTY